MGLLDNLGSAVKDVANLGEGVAPGLITSALAKSDLGNMQGLVEQLKAGGLGAQVQSWLSNDANLPVSADQLRAALGNQQVRQLAEHFGLPVDSALDLLAKHLPAAVDQASPNGTVADS
jgi:uncharacterized protein YidB (DUF937 family)